MTMIGTGSVSEVRIRQGDGFEQIVDAVGARWLEGRANDHRGGWGTFLASNVTGSYYYPPAGDDAGR